MSAVLAPHVRLPALERHLGVAVAADVAHGPVLRHDVAGRDDGWAARAAGCGGGGLVGLRHSVVGEGGVCGAWVAVGEYRGMEGEYRGA